MEEFSGQTIVDMKGLESASKAQASLHLLPVELLIIIIQLVQEGTSLKPLSGVNSLFRRLCTPIIFRTLRITCSKVGLDRLALASQSSIRVFVKTIRYEIPELIGPLTQYADSSRSCIYTVYEYAHDRADLWWPIGRRGISCSRIYSYFSAQSREQDYIIRSARDIRVLRTSLPCFPRLHCILLCFINGLKSPFQPLSDRVLLDGQPFYPDHVEKLATAVVAARRQGVVIDTLAISGYYPRHFSPDPRLSHLLEDAFADVQELRLEESPALLEYFTRNPLHCLQRLEFGSYWMSVLKLEEFIYAHRATIRYLHLEDIWYIITEDETSGIDLSIADTTKALESISHIRQWGILRELTINRQIAGHCEIREVFNRT